MLSIFDDGSSTETDITGAVTAVTDNSGADIPVVSTDGGITQQFMNLVTYGVGSLINNRLPPATAPKIGVQPAPRPVAAQVSSLLASPGVKIAGLALLGFFLFKKFA